MDFQFFLLDSPGVQIISSARKYHFFTIFFPKIYTSIVFALVNTSRKMFSGSEDNVHPFVSDLHERAFCCYIMKYDAGLWGEIYHIRKLLCFRKRFIINDHKIFQTFLTSIEIVKLNSYSGCEQGFVTALGLFAHFPSFPLSLGFSFFPGLFTYEKSLTSSTVTHPCGRSLHGGCCIKVGISLQRELVIFL